MSCGVGSRHGSDPMLLWLWCRPAKIAPIRPVAWEPPYAAGAALKKYKRQKKKKKNWYGVPSAVQWGKNTIAVALVVSEAWI